MRLDNSFTVSFPPEQAWAVLTDLERIAPCMPGVHLDAAAGEEFHGGLRVKVGPIAAEYSGTARFVERDPGAGIMIVRAEGRELRGRGAASATVTMTLVPATEGTRVDLATDLSISGRLAQFGRGVLGEVTSRLLDEFVRALEQEVVDPRRESAAAPAAGVSRAAPAATPAAGRAPAVTDLAAEPWPDDEIELAPTVAASPASRVESAAGGAMLLRAIAIPVAKRVVPVLLAVIVLILLVWWLA